MASYAAPGEQLEAIVIIWLKTKEGDNKKVHKSLVTKKQ